MSFKKSVKLVTFTSQLDTDKIILSKISDFDIINLCIAYPELWFNKDSNFWQKLMFKRFRLKSKEHKSDLNCKSMYYQIHFFVDFFKLSVDEMEVKDLKEIMVRNDTLINFLMKKTKNEYNLTKRVREINSFLLK